MSTVVLGLGASGRAALGLLKRRGVVDLVGVDLRESLGESGADPVFDGVDLQLGPHRRETFNGAERIVVSPGIPPTVPDLVAAREAGVPVVGEVALAVELALDPTVPVVGISGTNGKSTVTHVTGQLLTALGLSPFVGGNLGDPVSNADRAGHGAYVLELSSYQLENAGALRADVGMLLNLTPDHLARHGDMAGYAAAKCRLFAHARAADVALIPVDDPWLTDARAGARGQRAWLGGSPGVQRRGTTVTVGLNGRSHVFDLSPLPLPGTHNQDNVAAALFAAWVLAQRRGLDVQVLQDTIGRLTGLPHRMQVVPTDDGRTWIDDSKSTNVASTLAAVKGLSTPTVLLLGGQWKGGGFAALVPHLDAVHTVVTFGRHGPDIADELAAAGVDPIRADSLEAAVQHARAHGRSGDIVLLSPGCASFDAFSDFTHRGRVFQDLAQHPS